MRQDIQTQKTNGAPVDTELLFNSRTTVGLLLDIRHGVDTLPERLAPLMTRGRSPSPRKASWLKENTDFLRALLPYIVIISGFVLWLKEPQAFRDIVMAFRGMQP